jgi:hypothetical protein
MLCWPAPIVVVLVVGGVLLPVALKTAIRRYAPHLIQRPASPEQAARQAA